MKEKSILLVKRKYEEISRGINSVGLNAVTIKTLLNKPTGYDPEEICQILVKDSSKTVGGVRCFTTRVCIDGEVKEIQSGSNLYVDEEYRKLDVGADLFMSFTFLHPSKCCLTGGISKMALKMYKALKYAIFETPRLIYLRKSRSVVHAVLKTESPMVTPLIWLTDGFLVIHRFIMALFTMGLIRKYIIRKESIVPDEVEQIAMCDGSRYYEVHDKKWFEWALKYSFSDDPRNKKKLYTVRKDGKIEAFFLTKMEFFEQASSRGFKNVLLGSVMEWGISNESRLQESDLYLMSLKCFPTDCDGIQIASANPKTIGRLKKYLFVGVGQSNMAVKLAGKKLKEYNDINQWRIRLAAGDTIVD